MLGADREGLVPTGEVAARLGVTPATATTMLQKLAELGLADYVPYKGVSLTPAGEQVALEVIRHHRLIEAFLAEALGMPRDRVHAEAEVLEHYISEDLEALIAAKLGEPSHDPHGNPIPGPDLEPPAAPEAALEPARRPLGSRAGPPRRGRGRRAAHRSLDGHTRGIARLWPFLGPAFIAAVAYIDPGNFATNISGGAKFGYLLLWVVLAANLVAMLVQAQSAKLGIATGKNLAELCRERFSPPHLDRPLAAGRGRRDGLRPRRDRRRRARPQPALRHPALRRRADRRRRHLHPARPAAARLPPARGGDHGPGRRRRRRLRLRALQRLARRRRSRPPPLRPRLRRHRKHPAGDRHRRRDGDAARHLPALGADPEPDRRPQRPTSAAASCASRKSTW